MKEKRGSITPITNFCPYVEKTGLTARSDRFMHHQNYL